MAIRLGIIGAGIMGERMLRAAIDHAAEAVDVCAIWDRDSDALDRVGPLLSARAASVQAVIDAADCVYVATPPGTHLAYAEQALAAGRAVFLEKPLATDVAAASAFAARHPGARIAVNFPFASSFAVDRLTQWRAEGVVGPSPGLAIRVAFRTWPRPWQEAAASWLDAPGEGGFTREVVSHFLFLTLRLLSEGVSAHGTKRLHIESAAAAYPVPGKSERTVFARLSVNGVPVTLEGGVGEIDADDHNTWTLAGAGHLGGAIRLRDWSYAERQTSAGAWQADPDAAPNERMRPLVLRRQLEGVARMTAGQPHRLATLGEALEVQVAVEAIRASLDA